MTLQPRFFRTVGILAGVIIGLLLAFGGTLPVAGAGDPPELPKPTRLEGGVSFYEVELDTAGGERGKVWIYLPKGHTPKTKKKVPCVVIAPAGTRLFHGMGLADGDRPEHLPWVEAGFAVVSYTIDGAFADDATDPQFIAAVKRFTKAEGGVANARDALDYALARVPSIDPERIYTSGHSSAATLSLQFAANDDRVKGCVAFAPRSDLEGGLKELVPDLEPHIPGFGKWLKDHCPLRQVAELECPVFLFQAADDQVIPMAETRAFAKALGKTNDAVELVTVEAGGHYDPMIDPGLPKAIAWVKGLGR